MSNRLINYIIGHRWAMEENAAGYYLRVYEKILDRKLQSMPFDREALEAEMGKPLESNRGVTVREGVATIDISGPIFKRADFFDMMSGATSHEIIAREFNAALRDDAVKAIVLSINSPGGECAGCNELSDMIFSARGQKPIVAYADGMAASAAYWIASAADEVVCDEIALVGSIGTVITVTDRSKQDSMLGIQRFEYVSSQSPRKRPDPGTKTGDAIYQELADDLTDVFGAKVARNRGVDIATVWEKFGQGGMFTGQKAVEAGLADRTGSYEQLLSDLAIANGDKRVAGRSRSAQASTLQGDDDMGLREKILAALGGDSEESSKGEEAAAPEVEPSASAPQGELETLQTELQAEREARQRVEAEQRTASATACVERHASRYLSNGAGDEEGDRDRFVRVATAIHQKCAAGESVSVEEFEELLSIPTAASILPTGTLEESELEGATRHEVEADPKKTAADAAVETVASNYKHVENGG